MLFFTAQLKQVLLKPYQPEPCIPELLKVVSVDLSLILHPVLQIPNWVGLLPSSYLQPSWTWVHTLSLHTSPLYMVLTPLPGLKASSHQRCWRTLHCCLQLRLSDRSLPSLLALERRHLQLASHNIWWINKKWKTWKIRLTIKAQFLADWSTWHRCACSGMWMNWLNQAMWNLQIIAFFCNLSAWKLQCMIIPLNE